MLDAAARFDEKEFKMSPTHFVVRMAQLDEKLEAARLAGNFPSMQRLLGEMTSLRRAMYGAPA